MIVTKNLNDLDLILGADFLFMNERIKAISRADLSWQEEDKSSHKIKIEYGDKYDKIRKNKVRWNKETIPKIQFNSILEYLFRNKIQTYITWYTP